MCSTHAVPSVASYRDAVTELVKTREPFDAIEDAIEAIADLTDDQKAALWLLAFSMRDRPEQLLEAQAHLAVVAG